MLTAAENEELSPEETAERDAIAAQIAAHAGVLAASLGQTMDPDRVLHLSRLVLGTATEYVLFKRTLDAPLSIEDMDSMMMGMARGCITIVAEVLN